MWSKSAATIVHERTPFNPESSRSALAHDVITALDSFTAEITVLFRTSSSTSGD